MSEQQFGVVAGSGPGARGRQSDRTRRAGRPRLAGDPTILRRPRAGRAGRHHRLAAPPRTIRPSAPTAGPDPSGGTIATAGRDPSAGTGPTAGTGQSAGSSPSAGISQSAGAGRGTVESADVARIAADAAGRVPGVSGAHPATVRMDDRSVGLDLHLITWYGHSVPAVAEAVRVAVADRVAADTGLTVAAVTVTVDDLLLPGVDVPGTGRTAGG
ncbi:Asp23/Gls24 family envelope stress response protein [Micromonospora sp. U21]|uniref:Asp23/Gls24 family envelope stress response protein n=1 Tax=Micromonospora sp. U21 TaxID=2824899 RepID=UPI001B370D0E|nr:Asp23/Gls24 family envelope stress response protein [Micromonospora sp. U21]MBQ0901191.1 Asp23/Gls24 family envelope stress response protein [Micromonospora sp. U21]